MVPPSRLGVGRNRIVCMHTCLHVWSSCVHACVLICVSKHEYLHVWAHVSAFMYVCVHVCVCACVCACVCLWWPESDAECLLSIFLVAPFSFTKAKFLAEIQVCQLLLV